MLGACADSTGVFWRSVAPEQELLEALSTLGATYGELPSQDWDGPTATVGGVRDVDLSRVLLRPTGWSAVGLPLFSRMGDPLCKMLADRCAPVLAFYEFDQTGWGVSLFLPEGKIKAFVSWFDLDLPDGVDALSADDLAAATGVHPQTVTPYLLAGASGKASPSDEFTRDDHWVRVDLMRSLGLMYPDPNADGVRHVHIVANC